MVPGNELSGEKYINCIGFQLSMVLVTGLHWGRGAKWRQGKRLKGYALFGVAIDGLFSDIRAPHGDFPLNFFV